MDDQPYQDEGTYDHEGRAKSKLVYRAIRYTNVEGRIFTLWWSTSVHPVVKPIICLGRYNDFDDKPGLCNGFHEHKTYAKRMPATWSLQQYIMLRGVGSNVRPLHSPSSKYTVRNEWESTHDPIILTYISVFWRPIVPTQRMIRTRDQRQMDARQ